MSVKCYALARISSEEIPLLVAIEKEKAKSYQEEAIRILVDIKMKSYKANTLNKIHSSNGLWLFSIDNSQCAHLALCASNYPASSGSRLLFEAMEEVEKNESKYYLEGTKLSKLEPKISNLLSSYNADPDFHDKFVSLNSKVNSIQLEMEENIKKMVDNQEMAKAIEKKSEHVSEMADRFQVTSAQVHRKMKCKQYAFYGLIALGFILLIVVIVLIAK